MFPWHKWEVEKPAWFTDHLKEIVSDHMIPKLSLEELHKKAGGERRRRSVGLPLCRQRDKKRRVGLELEIETKINL